MVMQQQQQQQSNRFMMLLMSGGAWCDSIWWVAWQACMGGIHGRRWHDGRWYRNIDVRWKRWCEPKLQNGKWSTFVWRKHRLSSDPRTSMFASGVNCLLYWKDLVLCWFDSHDWSWCEETDEIMKLFFRLLRPSIWNPTRIRKNVALHFYWASLVLESEVSRVWKTQRSNSDYLSVWPTNNQISNLCETHIWFVRDSCTRLKA